MLGFVPSGSEHPELMVLVLLVCAKVTRLNTTLPQLIVPLVPVNVTVPPFALNTPAV